MIGGFLGSGKTSAMIRLAEYLYQKDQSVGLVTNDQSVGLVDTARVRNVGLPVKEITGSCFCCNFNGLIEVSDLFAEASPDVIIVEPVGSCTDLKATVSYPLRKFHGTKYDVAPLSVLVDPLRLGQVLGLLEGKSFSEKVSYIYLKQLEEAEILVINKVDLLQPEFRQKLLEETQKRFPQKKIFEVSCKTGEGLNAWFDEILTGQLGNDPPMDVDYDVYAEGEALMGWLNARFIFEGPIQYIGTSLIGDIATEIRNGLRYNDIEIAHLKLSLIPHDVSGFTSVSITHTSVDAQITDLCDKWIKSGEITVNLRAEADPELLRKVVRQVLKNHLPTLDLSQPIHAFRPGRPNPTHRMDTQDSTIY